MTTTLERDRPDLICEVLAGRGTEEPLAEMLRLLGYRFYVLTGNGPVEQADVRRHLRWSDYLFSCRPPAEVAEL